MRKFYRAYRFFFWTHQEKRLFFKSLFWLTFSKIAIPVFSFKKLQPYLGEVSAELDILLAPEERLKIKQVKAAIHRGTRVLPFHCQCLVTAICARKLLRDLQCQPRLYLGVAKAKDLQLSEEDLDPSAIETGLAAHAWVKLGSEWVVGQSKTPFTIVKIFA